jgi:CheY-like chemotaxis protein
MKPKILLVEDNANSHYLAQFLLEREGWAVTVALDFRNRILFTWCRRRTTGPAV